MTEIYLGYPPDNVKAWILAHSAPTPAENRETMFYFADGTSEECLIEGTLDQYWMIDNGYYDYDNGVWLKPITKAEIGAGVTSIGVSAFENCSSLTSVTIPSSVTSIVNGTFWNCSGLTTVMIPEGVTTIGDMTFASCSGLTSVTIPSSVTSIYGTAFFDCANLTVHVPNQTIKDLVLGPDSMIDGSKVVIDGQADEEPAAKTPVWGQGVWHVMIDGNEYALSNSQYDAGPEGYYGNDISLTKNNIAYQDAWTARFDASKSERQDITFTPPSPEAPNYSATIWWTES